MKKIILFAFALLVAVPAYAEQLFLSGAGSNKIHVFFEDTSKVATDRNIGLTGVAFGTSGLELYFSCDTEATATAYTSAGSTIETITTLGTFAAPTATKIRLKEFDSTHEKGVYEVQVDDARVINTARSCTLCWTGTVTNLRDGCKEIPVLASSPSVSCDKWNGTSVATPNTAGVPIVDLGRWNGTVVTGTAPQCSVFYRN